MPRLRNLCMMTAALVLVRVGPATAAVSAMKQDVVRAKAALVDHDTAAAGRELRAASDSLVNSAVRSAPGAKAQLEASAREMKTLAEEAENGTLTGPERLEDACARAESALATAESANTTSLHTLFRDLGGDFKHLPSRDSLWVAAIGGGLALAVHPADSSFNQRLANDGGFFKTGNILGNGGTLLGASAAAYGIGRVTGNSRIAHTGLDLLRAQIVTETMVESLKYTVRRPRPDGSGGFSFPSGHAAMAFATATVLERHHGLKWAIPAYALASYVAMSRLHDNVHNLSDVMFGSAVGIIAGRTVTRHGRSNFALVPFATPHGRGLLVAYSWK
jgi:membrane-associated phospholipid phosphatase